LGKRHRELVDARDVFRDHGGTLRFSEAMTEGITEYALRRMLEEGLVERISRGVYRLSEMAPMAEPDLVVAAQRVPHGVICLLSALSFHDITTQVPHEVMLALSRSRQRREPSVGYPPIHFLWFGGRAFSEGIETHEIDGTSVRVYGPEKTIADCFKFRNKIGLDVAIEGLRLQHERHGIDVDALTHYARICRVQNVIRPYLEATL
jgi:predicted transcriptional regulator of viral defense system